jgi:hypothetical protein
MRLESENGKSLRSAPRCKAAVQGRWPRVHLGLLSATRWETRLPPQPAKPARILLDAPGGPKPAHPWRSAGVPADASVAEGVMDWADGREYA